MLRVSANVLNALMMVTLVASFNPKRWSPYSGSGDGHYVITEDAIDAASIDFLKSWAAKRGIEIPGNTPNKVVSYCSALGLPCSNYEQAMTTIADADSRVDDDYPNLARYHFDAESFRQANDMLIKNKQAIVVQINGSSAYDSARELAGKILHSLQDFYSHSDWIEMGETLAHRHLARNTLTLGDIADPTCSDCGVIFQCENNILPEILEKRILTSGYYGGQDILKPEGVGKCSHGGALDTSSQQYASGGINKDVRLPPFSPHNYLQVQAVATATDGTYHFFLDIWNLIGDEHFGRFMGLIEENSIVFVIDTNKPSSTELDLALESADKLTAQTAFSSKKNDVVYTVVPFSSGSVGATYTTSDPIAFRRHLKTLKKTSAKSSSESFWAPDTFEAIRKALDTVRTTQATLYVYTNDSPKVAGSVDKVLPSLKYRDVVLNFFITSEGSNKQFKTYQELAATTGGQVQRLSYSKKTESNTRADVSKMERSIYAISVSNEQAPTKQWVFNGIQVDRTVKNLTIRVVSSDLGLNSVEYTRPNTNPIEVIIDDQLPQFISYRFPEPTVGSWGVKVSSNSSFTVVFSGISDLNLRSQMGKVSDDPDNPFAGFISYEGEPISNIPASVMVDVTKAFLTQDTVTNVKVSLISEIGEIIDSANADKIDTSGESNTEGSFLATVNVPSRYFRILVEGRIKSDNTVFQRIDSRIYRPVPFTVRTFDGNNTNVDTNFIQVNIPLELSFAVDYVGDKAVETFSLSALDSQRAIQRVFPSVIEVAQNKTGYFKVEVLITDQSKVGAVELVFAYANDSDGRTNYVRKQMPVMPEVIDIIPPRFDNFNYEDISCANLSSVDCHADSWSASVRFYEQENGLHAYTYRIIDDISAQKNGSFKLTVRGFVQNQPGVPAEAYLIMDCCISEVELIAIDNQGNLDSAYFSNALKVTPPVVENGIEWWVILLSVIGGLALLAGIVALSVYIFKKVTG